MYFGGQCPALGLEEPPEWRLILTFLQQHIFGVFICLDHLHDWNSSKCRTFVYWLLMWVFGHTNSSLLLLAVLNQGWIYILPADLVHLHRKTQIKCVSLFLLSDKKATERWNESLGLALVACIFLGTGTFISTVPFQESRKRGVIGEKKESGGWKAF